jgi:hypothetical protein
VENLPHTENKIIIWLKKKSNTHLTAVMRSLTYCYICYNLFFVNGRGTIKKCVGLSTNGAVVGNKDA